MIKEINEIRELTDNNNHTIAQIRGCELLDKYADLSEFERADNDANISSLNKLVRETTIDVNPVQYTIRTGLYRKMMDLAKRKLTKEFYTMFYCSF